MIDIRSVGTCSGLNHTPPNQPQPEKIPKRLIGNFKRYGDLLTLRVLIRHPVDIRKIIRPSVNNIPLTIPQYAGIIKTAFSLNPRNVITLIFKIIRRPAADLIGGYFIFRTDLVIIFL